MELLRDYRDLQGSFDKVVSVGMFEHVGPKNYDTYFTNVRRLMAPKASSCCTPSASPPPARAPILDRPLRVPQRQAASAVEISTAVEGRFIIEDWHNFGADYDRTLMAWWDRFQRAWPQLEARYGKRFYRMWRYYLMCCAGFFRSREGQLWQVILTHPQRGDTYRSLRWGRPPRALRAPLAGPSRGAAADQQSRIRGPAWNSYGLRLG